MIGINGQPLRIGRAWVIRTGDLLPDRPTTAIRYTRNDESAAWYAELRAKQQAVRP